MIARGSQRGATFGAVAMAIGLGLAAGCGDDGDSGVDANLGPHTITGVVRYEDRPQQSSGRLGTVQQLPARAVSISLIAEDDGAVLAEGVTGDDGTFTLSFDSTMSPAEPVHLLAATFSEDPNRPVQVLRSDGTVHGFGGPPFGNEATSQDLLVTESSGSAGAFNVYDQLVLNADTIRAELGRTPEMLTARWQLGSNDGTYYRRGGNTMHLLGASSDDDGYDDTVILHEAGHYVEDTIGRSDSPGGQHNGSPTNPTLAWSEGFSTYWALAVRKAPVYGDSNAGGGWAFNADVSITRTPMPTGTMDQLVAENMISEILWDMGDAPSGGDDDMLPGDHLANNRVQPDYLRAVVLRTVGVAGVDLVDFLDGWFVADGLADCAAVRGIVTTTHRFPYDYAGPAGACPP